MSQPALPFSFLDLFIPGAGAATSAMSQFGTQAAQKGVAVSVRPGGAPGQRVPRGGPGRPGAPKVVEEAKKGEGAKTAAELDAEQEALDSKKTFVQKAKRAAPVVGATLGIGTAVYLVGRAILRG